MTSYLPSIKPLSVCYVGVISRNLSRSRKRHCVIVKAFLNTHVGSDCVSRGVNSVVIGGINGVVRGCSSTQLLGDVIVAGT